jgi:hypothetical protein
MTVYKANLQRIGPAISETVTLLAAYARHGDWERVRAAALRDNLLQKGSSKTIQDILLGVQRRVFQNAEMLPPAPILAQAMVSEMSAVAKTQLVFAYICASDPLVAHVVADLVRPIAATSLEPRLTAKEVRAFLVRESDSHPELASWSDTLRKRWAGSFMSLMRAMNMVEPLPGNRLQAPLVRVETFFFLLLGLLGREVPPNRALTHTLWDWYLLSDAGKESLLAEAQGRGWLHYARLAEIVELEPRYRSVEEWLHAGLE